jgi:hypothetical protein
VEAEGAAKVAEIAASYANDLDIITIDQGALDGFYQRAEALGLPDIKEGISLTGYGAMRNFALIVAAVFDFTEVIFIDDDEVVEDKDFLDKAVYGLGKLTKKGIPVLVKSGFYTDKRGGWKAREKDAWYNHYWHQGDLFNVWITRAMSGPRLTRSNGFYGGLCSIHREAYRRVSFDPWISRGEDLDYLLNIRMYGGDVWFDNKWAIHHLPPTERAEAQRFRQDIYRWIYEHRKLEYSKSQIDLLQIQPHSLDPYPGPFLEHSISRRVFLTAMLRMIGRSSERHGYLRAALAAQREAKAYAEVFCSKYFEFQLGWPQIVATFENDYELRRLFARNHADFAEKDEDFLVSRPPDPVASSPFDGAIEALAKSRMGEDNLTVEPADVPMGAHASTMVAVGQHARKDGDGAPDAGAADDLLDFDLDLDALGVSTSAASGNGSTGGPQT